MRIGILALAAIFILSGAKNLQDSGIARKIGKKNEQNNPEEEKYSRRKLVFGVWLMLLGILVAVYYVATLLG